MQPTHTGDTPPGATTGESPTLRGADQTTIGGLQSAMAELRRLYLAGETEAALAVAESVRPGPVTTPWPLEAIPLVNMTPQQIMQLPLDPQSGFLLARIDGVTPLKTILDISAMPHESAMNRIEHLVQLGAVRMLVPSAETPTLS